MMPLQRVRIAESRIRNKLSNGPPRAQSNTARGSFPEAAGLWSILRRGGIRQLPEICWYLAKGTAQAVNQGGTAGHRPVLDRMIFSVEGGFFGSLPGRGGGQHECNVGSGKKNRFRRRLPKNPDLPGALRRPLHTDRGDAHPAGGQPPLLPSGERRTK